MPVGLRSRDRFRPDDASRAALVVDDHLLAEPLGKLEGDHAADDVVAAAGRKRDDHPHRLARVRLRGCARRIRCGGEEREKQAERCGS